MSIEILTISQIENETSGVKFTFQDSVSKKKAVSGVILGWNTGM